MLARDRVALVTGGSRGIGRAIAERLLAEGAQVAITGRSAEKGERAVAEMGGGDRLAFFSGDARSQRDVEGWVDATVERFGVVEVLVNNAGGSSDFAYLEDLSDEAWQECANWTLNSGFWATRRVLGPMRAKGWGRIVGISSVESKGHVTPTASHYTVFKAAMNALSRAVAIEYGPHGITSNVICPGAVETDLMQVTGRAAAKGMGMTYEAFLDGYAQKTLTKSINTVEEVAATAALLISEAGGGITGTSINVDAGTSTY